jgi:hypothetical protein
MLVADSFLIEWQVPFRNSIWLMTADQRLAPSNKISRAVEHAKVFGWTSSAETSPMSSRASQNAAALLFDSGTVDIR